MKDEAIALCRVSTVKQRLEGSSLEAQEERVYAAAVELHAEIVKVWSHNISSRKGKNFKRKDLTEMLAYVKAHKKVKFFIVDEPDRFMRDFEAYYFWKVRFKQEAGVKLVYAKKPHLAFEDNPVALMEEMIDVFRAETSNQERITKTVSNMQMRVKLGYYPGRIKPGYQATDTPGLQRPDEPRWSLLKQAFLDTIEGYPLKEVNQRLNNNGYKTKSGNPMDLFNLRKILVDPFYAGIIHMSNWPENPHGLHQPMVSLRQYEMIASIVQGTKRIKYKKFNPEFNLSNRMECRECIQDKSVRHPRLVGYVHNNGKPGEKRKFYKRYRCRGCGANILRDDLHERVSRTLLDVQLNEAKRNEFMSALRIVWEEDESESFLHARTLERRLEQRREEKNKLVRQAAMGIIAEEDIQDALKDVKSEIKDLEQQISSARDVEKDFVEFVDFTMRTIDEMQDEFWKLDEEHLGWCKQLLFPGGFSVSRDGKVYTPKVSEFYRLVATQKDPEGSQSTNMVVLIRNNLHLLKQEASRWRSIIEPLYTIGRLRR